MEKINSSIKAQKPILLLLLDSSIMWPPVDLSFCESHLYIRFFPKPGEETVDDTHWPKLKFDQLLDELRSTLPPKLSIKPKRISSSESHSELFISYHSDNKELAVQLNEKVFQNHSTLTLK